MGLGPRADVVEPPSLRERVATDAARMNERLSKQETAK
jgi:predicted DNA-binding transcriptional regulator YafY